MTDALVLVVEDDREIADILRAFLERDGFRVMVARDGSTALEAHRRLAPDLVVLDVRLPGLDGVEVLAELRRRDATPVIMASALGEDLDKLTALRLGADDYLVKPFNPMELVARARAVLRRARSGWQPAVLRLGALEVDTLAHEARAGGQPLALTPTEFRILSHLGRAPRRAFTRAEIADACLPAEGNALDRTVDSHMAKLRGKLEAAGLAPMLESVRGVGYRLSPP